MAVAERVIDDREEVGAGAPMGVERPLSGFRVSRLPTTSELRGRRSDRRSSTTRFRVCLGRR